MVSKLLAILNRIRSHLDSDKAKIVRFVRRPLVVKALSSAAGYGIGDIMAQSISYQFQLPRFLRMSLFGLLIHGPLNYFFYTWLFQRMDGVDTNTVMKRVAVEQSILSPLIAAQLLIFTGVLKGNSPYQIYISFNPTVLFLIGSSWLLWPAAHFVNFRYLAAKRRLLFINCIQLLSNAIQSLLIN
ncbi:hypothetical protein B484DRAFT_340157 [Ochromonadaceae sp. CCMP2298]|nr:hypothetical protein B484DRAFT_340157 [Ochromonadaceae sp. CCMP2298]